MNTPIEKRVCLVLIGTLVVLCILMLIMAAVPPVSRDALTHHLALPKLWITSGGIYETPDIIFSYYPMNLDLLYVLPMLAGNDIFPKYIHMAFGLATAILLFSHLKTRLNRAYALGGALFFLSLPVVVKLSITVYVDLGLVFFSTASLLLLIAWQRGGCLSRYRLLGSAVCCGLALGTKYNALVMFLLMTLMVPAVSAARRSRATEGHSGSVSAPAIKDGVFFGSIALIVFAPWIMRNLIWTGNPLYPLYDGLFNPQTSQGAAGMHPLVIRKLVYGESLWETILIPLRIFFQGQDDVPALFDGRLNPGLLIFPLLNFLLPTRATQEFRWEKRLLAIFAVLFVLIVFLTQDMRIRYIAPAIPALVLLSVYGAHTFFGRLARLQGTILPRCLRAGVSLVIVFCLSWNGVYIAELFAKVRPMAYLGGELTREAYIESYRPEYSAVQYLNRSMTAGDRVACLFLGNRRYYFEGHPVFIEWSEFKRQVEATHNGETLARYFQNKGITHLIIGGQRLQEWSQRSLSVENQRKLEDFLANQLEIRFNKNGYLVFSFPKRASN